MKHPGLIAVMLLAFAQYWADGPSATAALPAPTNRVGRPLPSTQLHNLFQATPQLFSGSAPDNDAAFTEIARLGVKIIVSVDGSKPDIDTAHKHGLTYIHLPIGYDGVSTNRVRELASVAQSSAGPLYVHCHHGLHRGPAAVAVMCEATAGWTTNQAVAWLRQAGTSDDYPGLYRSAMEFHRPETTTLSGIVELPEVARTSSLVEAMVAIDAEFERLKAAQKAGWSKLPLEPDLAPARAATILWEHFRELARTDDTAGRPKDYRAKLAASEKAIEHLRALLWNPRENGAARDTAFQAVGKSCAACHQHYRN